MNSEAIEKARQVITQQHQEFIKKIYEKSSKTIEEGWLESTVPALEKLVAICAENNHFGQNDPSRCSGKRDIKIYCKHCEGLLFDIE